MTIKLFVVISKVRNNINVGNFNFIKKLRNCIGIVIGCILDSWRIEEYEITNESSGGEVNITGMIQFTTPRKTLHDSDISDRLIKVMEIHFDYDGHDIDDSVIYEKCQYLETDFWLETNVDSSTVEAKAMLKEID